VSSDSVEDIHVRLREEIERCGYSLAAASRAIGDTGPQSLKDVVAGRKKCPAELVGRLSVIGVDIFYVLTGAQKPGVEKLKPDETALLDNYRHLCDEQREAVFRVSEVMSSSQRQEKKTNQG